MKEQNSKVAGRDVQVLAFDEASGFGEINVEGGLRVETRPDLLRQFREEVTSDGGDSVTVYPPLRQGQGQGQRQGLVTLRGYHQQWRFSFFFHRSAVQTSLERVEEGGQWILLESRQ